MDVRKVAVGLVLLLLGTVGLFMAGPVSSTVPPVALAVIAVVLSAGTLLVGTSDGDRPA